jgi:hypothetical protein
VVIDQRQAASQKRPGVLIAWQTQALAEQWPGNALIAARTRLANLRVVIKRIKFTAQSLVFVALLCSCSSPLLRSTVNKSSAFPATVDFELGSEMPVHQLPIIEARVGERSFRAFVDCGSNFSCVPKWFADEHGFATARPLFLVIDGVDQERKHGPEIIRLPGLSIGTMMFAPLDMRMYEQDVGIIGGNILEHFIVDFDFARKQFSLRREMPDVSEFLAPMPVTFISVSMPVLEVVIGGSKFRMLIDSGSDVTLMDSECMQKLHAMTTGRTSSTFGLGTPITEYHCAVAAVTGTKLCDAAWSRSGLRDRIEADGLIGMDALSKFSRVIIDYPGRMLWLRQ